MSKSDSKAFGRQLLIFIYLSFKYQETLQQLFWDSGSVEMGEGIGCKIGCVRVDARFL
jgi:hypothetical protein